MTRKKQYEIIKSVLDKRDPMGLLKMDAPADEYSQEASIIERIINETKRSVSFNKIVESVFLTQFNELLPRMISRNIANDIRTEFYFWDFCDELTECETLKDKIEIVDYGVRLKLHEYFIAEFICDTIFINDKKYCTIEDQDVLEYFCGLCNDDTVYVEYKHRHFTALGFTHRSYFDEISKKNFSQKKIRHKNDVEIVFDKNGLY